MSVLIYKKFKIKIKYEKSFMNYKALKLKVMFYAKFILVKIKYLYIGTKLAILKLMQNFT